MNAPAKTAIANAAAEVAAVTDINAILPEAVIIKTSKGDVEVKTIETRQARAAMKHVQALRGRLGSDIKNLDVTDLLMEQTDVVIALVAILSDKDEAFIDSLKMDEMIVLTTAVLETNLDFFIQKVLPLLSALATKLTSAMGRAPAQSGQTLSNPS